MSDKTAKSRTRIVQVVTQHAKIDKEEEKQASDVLLNDITADIENNQTVDYFMSEIIKSNPVVLFSRTYCPYCFELKRTLISYGVHFAVYEVDQVPHLITQIKAVLTTLSGSHLTPSLFVQGVSIGRCSDCKALEFSGRLLAILAPFVNKPLSRNPVEIQGLGHLYYPDTVNLQAVRVSAVLAAMLTVVCVYFYSSKATKWVILGLSLDYGLRAVFGFSASLFGMIGIIGSYWITPKYAAGPPFQFAVIGGAQVAAVAAGLLFTHNYYFAIAFMCIIIVVNVLEGVFEVCLGCHLFDVLVHHRIVSPASYYVHLNLFASRSWLGKFKNSLPPNHTHPPKRHILLPGQTTETPHDLQRKERFSFEYKLKDIDVVRHSQVTWFLCPMAIGMVAYMFRLTSGQDLPNHGSWGTEPVTIALTIVTVVMAVIISIVYLLRTIYYYHKIQKDWEHPVLGNYFSAIPMTFVWIGILWSHYHPVGGGLLIWIGAITQFFITIGKVSDYLYSNVYASEEFINANMLLLSAGNLVTSIGVYELYTITMSTDNYSLAFHGRFHYGYLSRMWFGIGSFLGLMYFVITMKRSWQENYYDIPLRLTLYCWLAVVCLFGVAYYKVSIPDITGEGDEEDVRRGVLFQSMWAISFFLFFMFAVGWFKHFFQYSASEMNVWILPFAYGSFAIFTLEYNEIVKSPLIHVFSLIAMSIATVTLVMCTLHTLLASMDHTLFVPRSKFSALEILTLSHEAFRYTLPKLMTFLTEHLEKSHGNSLYNFLVEVEQFFDVYQEHAALERDIIFPRMRRLFPKIHMKLDDDHEVEEKKIEMIRKAIAKYREDIRLQPSTAPVAAGILIKFLRISFHSLVDHILGHLREEELTISVILRKYIPMDYQIEMCQEIFEYSSGEKWRVIFAFLLKHLPTPQWKVKLVQSILWGNPSRAQEIGLMIYPHVEHITWLVLVDEIPEIIPRGLPGYRKTH